MKGIKMNINEFKNIKLTTKNKDERIQKEYIINHIETIINDIIKNNNDFIESDIDISINFELFKIYQLQLKYDKIKVNIYKIIDNDNNEIYFIYNTKNNRFMKDYSRIESNSKFTKNKEYLKKHFDTFTKIDDFIERYKIDDFSIIEYNKKIFLNNIHKTEIK